MSIRKTGAATGQVTEVEQEPQALAPVTAVRQETGTAASVSWAPRDERALALENEAADQ
jgi:hypothetical protein